MFFSTFILWKFQEPVDKTKVWINSAQAKNRLINQEKALKLDAWCDCDENIFSFHGETIFLVIFFYSPDMLSR